jgi:hypothetical protein
MKKNPKWAVFLTATIIGGYLLEGVVKVFDSSPNPWIWGGSMVLSVIAITVSHFQEKKKN